MIGGLIFNMPLRTLAWNERRGDATGERWRILEVNAHCTQFMVHRLHEPGDLNQILGCSAFQILGFHADFSQWFDRVWVKDRL